MRRIVAVVPVYRPSPLLLDRVAALAPQVAEVIVVDDGSPGSPETIDLLESTGTRVLRHPENRGIAAALNTGIAAALEGGADVVLTLDQDTLLPEEYVDICCAVFEAAETGGLSLGAVAAGAVNGNPMLPHEYVDGIGLMAYAIQSGLMITREALEVCGPFDERLVIDLVDTEYCLRMWNAGFAIAAALGANIDHELGVPKPARVFGHRRMRDGVERTYDYHAPFRQYYISRNGIDVALRYARRNPRWAIGSTRHDLVGFLTGFLAGPARGRHFAAAALGVAHALRRKRGLLSEGWRKRLSVTDEGGS